MARLPEATKVAARIVVDRDGKHDAPFEVLLDGVDRRQFAVEDNIENIGALFEPQSHAVVLAELALTDVQAVQTAAIVLGAPRFFQGFILVAVVADRG
jgi:hypothetical protein